MPIYCIYLLWESCTKYKNTALYKSKQKLIKKKACALYKKEIHYLGRHNVDKRFNLCVAKILDK